VDDITVLDSWVIYGQGHFTKNTDLFPRKIGTSFNGCPMKVLVHDIQSEFKTKLTYESDSIVSHYDGLEIKLIQTALQKMNMTFLGAIDGLGEIKYIDVGYAMLAKQNYIYLGDQLNLEMINLHFDTTSVYQIHSVRWYVPCSVKHPRWSSIFRILSW
jgi:hypothetical protein